MLQPKSEYSYSLFSYLAALQAAHEQDKEARYHTNSKEQKMNQEIIIINSSKGKITGENAGGPKEEEFYFLLLEEHDLRERMEKLSKLFIKVPNENAR